MVWETMTTAWFQDTVDSAGNGTWLMKIANQTATLSKVSKYVNKTWIYIAHNILKTSNVPKILVLFRVGKHVLLSLPLSRLVMFR